jgi:hypothetical protein
LLGWGERVRLGKMEVYLLVWVFIGSVDFVYFDEGVHLIMLLIGGFMERIHICFIWRG